MTRRRKLKWEFAIGTTSLVPVSDWNCFGIKHPNFHYIIADIDDKEINAAAEFLLNEMPWNELAFFPTKRGWHIYTNAFMPWQDTLNFIRTIPGVDQNWIRIGERRGYLFLADKTAVELNWPVRRMVIYAKKKGNSRRT